LFTRIHHLFLSWNPSIPSMPSHCVYLRFIIVVKRFNWTFPDFSFSFSSQYSHWISFLLYYLNMFFLIFPSINFKRASFFSYLCSRF
jgi:hypothetical protein